MGILNISEFGGVNQRSNGLSQPQNYALDSRNIRKDERGNITKRSGYSSVLSSSGIVKIFSYGESEEILALKDDGKLYKVVGQNLVQIPFGNSAPTDKWGQAGVDSVEVEKNKYFTDEALKNYPYKYDGSNFYRAGVPVLGSDWIVRTPPSLPPSGSDVPAGCPSATNYYFVAYLEFTDANGVIHNSDLFYPTNIDQLGEETVRAVPAIIWYPQNPSYTLKAYKVIDVDIPLSAINSVATEFHKRWGFTGDSITVAKPALNVLNKTTAQHNYNVGDIVVYTADSTRLWKFRVTAISPTQVTLDPNEFNVPDGMITIFDERYKLHLYYTSTNGANYKWFETKNLFDRMREVYTVVNCFGDGARFITGAGITILPPESVYLDDTYDSSTVKGLPPLAKYITKSDNVIVLAGIKEEEGSPESNDKIFWSDVHIGSTVESFAPFDYDIIGRSDEGGITGIANYQRTLVVLKKKQHYLLNGVLPFRQYTITKGMSSGVGCVSNQSIVELEGGVGFVTNIGPHHIGDGEFKNISDQLTPFFKDNSLDMTNSVAIIDPDRMFYFTWIDGYVFYYDFYRGEWFIWDNLNASKGVILFNGLLYFSDGAKIFSESNSFNDNGKAITAYYRTSWIDSGAQSIKKKFTSAVAMSTMPIDSKIYTKFFFDWSDSEFVGSEKSIYGVATSFNIPGNSAYSMSMLIGNDNINENFRLSGLSINIEDHQANQKAR